MSEEPSIIINGKELTAEQAWVVRQAVHLLAAQCNAFKSSEAATGPVLMKTWSLCGEVWQLICLKRKAG